MPLNEQEQLDQLEASILRCLRVAKKPQYWKEVQRLASISLDRPAAALLMLLGKHSCKFQELVEQVGVEAPAVSRKVHELEDQGLIIRQATDDKRVHLLSLSSEGERVAKRIRKAQCEMLAEVIGNWTANDKEQFINLFAKFTSEFEAKFKISAQKEIYR